MSSAWMLLALLSALALAVLPGADGQGIFAATAFYAEDTRSGKGGIYIADSWNNLVKRYVSLASRPQVSTSVWEDGLVMRLTTEVVFLLQDLVASSGMAEAFFCDATALYSAPLDRQASNAATRLVGGLHTCAGLTLDEVNEHVYISDSGAGAIFRVSFDGTGLEKVAAVHGPGVVAYDAVSHVLYFSQGAAIFAHDLDTGKKTLLHFGLGAAIEHMEFDWQTRRLFWSEPGRGVMSADTADTSKSSVVYDTTQDVRFALDTTAGGRYVLLPGEGRLIKQGADGKAASWLKLSDYNLQVTPSAYTHAHSVCTIQQSA
jgi:hypothetical protein